MFNANNATTPQLAGVKEPISPLAIVIRSQIRAWSNAVSRDTIAVTLDFRLDDTDITEWAF